MCSVTLYRAPISTSGRPSAMSRLGWSSASRAGSATCYACSGSVRASLTNSAGVRRGLRMREALTYVHPCLQTGDGPLVVSLSNS